MTRDEAIQFLDNIKHAEAGRAIGKEGFYAELLGYHIQAINMAIKALEQQTCEDAVSRQAVLDIFADNADATRPYSKTWEEVKALPSVNPQPKIGHWIKIPGMNEQCDVCGKFFPLLDFVGKPFEINFCPACGTKMAEPQESEEI